MRIAFVLASTAVFGVIGFLLGSAARGSYAAAIVPTCAGAAGGVGIGCAALDVLRRWRANRTPGTNAR